MYSDVRNVGFSVMKSQAIVYDQDLSAAPKDVPFLDIHDMRIKDVAPQKYYKSVKVTSRTGNILFLKTASACKGTMGLYGARRQQRAKTADKMLFRYRGVAGRIRNELL